MLDKSKRYLIVGLGLLDQIADGKLEIHLEQE